jgi:hypothetical protein
MYCTVSARGGWVQYVCANTVGRLWVAVARRVSIYKQKTLTILNKQMLRHQELKHIPFFAHRGHSFQKNRYQGSLEKRFRGQRVRVYTTVGGSQKRFNKVSLEYKKCLLVDGMKCTYYVDLRKTVEKRRKMYLSRV